MPKASEVASELRKLADSLDREPDAKVEQFQIQLWSYDKDTFLETARLLPRPLAKGEDKFLDKYTLSYGCTGDPVHVVCMIDKAKACKLIKPAQEAVYECLPILSAAEEAALETAVEA